MAELDRPVEGEEVRVSFAPCPRCGEPHDRKKRCSRAKPVEPAIASARSLRSKANEAQQFKLTREQRQALYAGKHPRLTFDAMKPCPVEAGQIIELSTNLWLGIKSTKRVQEGRVFVWLIDYTAHQDRPRLLRASPHEIDFKAIKERKPLNHDEEVRAAEESAYTSSSNAALKGAGEEISREDQERFTEAAKTETLAGLHKLWESLSAQLKDLEEHPDMAGASSELRFVRTKLQQIQEKIDKRIRSAEARA